MVIGLMMIMQKLVWVGILVIQMNLHLMLLLGNMMELP